MFILIKIKRKTLTISNNFCLDKIRLINNTYKDCMKNKA